MPRAPFQILVLPYRRRTPGAVEYAVFRRSDLEYWQGIAGGGEDDELPAAAARREGWEEARIPLQAAYIGLATHGTVPIVVINQAARQHWPRDLYVLPQYTFAVDCGTTELALSAEHTAYAWLPYHEAHTRLHWDIDRTALWELNERLGRNVLQPGNAP